MRFLILLLASGLAQAEGLHSQDSWFPWYRWSVFTEISQTSIQYSASDALMAAGYQADQVLNQVDGQDDWALRLGGAFSVRSWLDVELAYNGFGHYSGRADVGDLVFEQELPGERFPFSETVNFSARGLDLSAKLSTPQWHGLSGFARVGGLYYRAETEVDLFVDFSSASIPIQDFSGTVLEVRDSGWSGFYSVGVQYDFYRRLAVSLSYQQVDDLANSSLQHLGVGFRYRF